MKFIKFNKDLCDECYKCLRECPTKAIAFTENTREIIDDLCVKCGLCQSTCPQKALSIQSDLDKVKHWLSTDTPTAVSLAPSFAAAFDTHKPLKIVAGLRQLGLNYIEETGFAAEYVSKKYEEYLNLCKGSNILTSCCPSANYLVERHFPNLIQDVIPVASPMVIHGRLLKQKLGKEIKILFIGPCLAKKAEAKEYKDAIDAVLTFDEINQWFIEKDIHIDRLLEGHFDVQATRRGKSYPVGGSLFNQDKSQPISKNYKMLRVDGKDECFDLLEAISNHRINNYCIEINMCKGSCINGPEMPHQKTTVFERSDRMHNYLKTIKFTDNQIQDDLLNSIDCQQSFSVKVTKQIKPSREELVNLLKMIGKYTYDDYLNCGACGYNTCFDKATAAFYGYSDIHMCMSYMRSKAEKLSNAIFDNTPNLIMTLNKEMIIQDYNPTFERYIDINTSPKGLPIICFMPEDIFIQAFEKKCDIKCKKITIEKLDKVFYCNVIYKESYVVGILTDITTEEQNKEELLAVKEKTITSCQNVIDNQMRVAQEIASLLGETTAETKVSLNRLKDLVLGDEGYSK